MAIKRPNVEMFCYFWAFDYVNNHSEIFTNFAENLHLLKRSAFARKENFSVKNRFIERSGYNEARYSEVRL